MIMLLGMYDGLGDIVIEMFVYLGHSVCSDILALIDCGVMIYELAWI